MGGFWGESQFVMTLIRDLDGEDVAHGSSFSNFCASRFGRGGLGDCSKGLRNATTLPPPLLLSLSRPFHSFINGARTLPSFTYTPLEPRRTATYLSESPRTTTTPSPPCAVSLHLSFRSRSSHSRASPTVRTAAMLATPLLAPPSAVECSTSWRMTTRARTSLSA